MQNAKSLPKTQESVSIKDPVDHKCVPQTPNTPIGRVMRISNDRYERLPTTGNRSNFLKMP